MGTNSDTVMQQWHHAMKNREIDALDPILADEVEFVSPIVHSPQKGIALTKKYLLGAMHVLMAGDSFYYSREVIGKNDAMLEFHTMIGDVEINGVDMLQWNDEGKLTEVKVMIRPLRAVNAIHEAMGAMLQKLS